MNYNHMLKKLVILSKKQDKIIKKMAQEAIDLEKVPVNASMTQLTKKIIDEKIKELVPLKSGIRVVAFATKKLNDKYDIYVEELNGVYDMDLIDRLAVEMNNVAHGKTMLSDNGKQIQVESVIKDLK